MISQALELNQDILIIEDDEDIADLISIYLRSQNYSTRTASSLKTASQMWADNKPDLIICDIMLPDGQGTEWVQEIKAGSAVPVIFLSSRSEREDIIRGLELGGDDYITKPFDPDIMVARVKARLRNAPSPSQGQQQVQPEAGPGAPAGKESGVWSDGRLELSFDGWEALLDGQAVTLSTKERQLLFFLAAHPGKVFSVEQLYEQIWGMDGWSDQRTVMVHISNLRRKIEDESRAYRYIATVRGIGYKFQPSTKVL